MQELRRGFCLVRCCEVVCRIQVVLDVDLETFGHVLVSIVVVHGRMACHGHGNGTFRDGLIAVGYLEGHFGEVGIDVGELLGCQAHVRRARIGLRGSSLLLRGSSEVSFGVRIRADQHIVTRNRMFAAVKDVGCVVPDNGDHDLVGRRHLRIAVHGHFKRNVKVLVVAAELIGSQTHVRRADIGLRSRSFACKGNVCHIEQLRVCLGVPALDHVRFPVVGCTAYLSNHAHVHLQRQYGHKTVGHVVGHVEIGVGVLEAFGGQTHVLRPRIDERHARHLLLAVTRRSKSRPGQRVVQRASRLKRCEAACHVLLPVINGGNLLADRFHRHVSGHDFQPAVLDAEPDPGEVIRQIPELLFRQAHRIAAHVDARDGIAAVEGEEAFLIAGIRYAGYRVAFCLLTCAVVHKRLGVALYAYHHHLFDGGDGQRAVGHAEHDVKVVIKVHESIVRKAHGRRACIGARCTHLAIHGEVGAGVQLA